MFILPITSPNNAPNHTMALSSLSITWSLLKKLSTSPSTIFDTISLPLLRSIVLMLLARRCFHKK